MIKTKVVKMTGLLLISSMFCASGWCKAGDPNDPIKIWDANGLQAIGKDKISLSKNYILVENIDLKGWGGEKGWEPIGWDEKPFTGTFDGGGKIIRNLRTDGGYYNAGLFGVAKHATFNNVYLEDVDVKGYYNTGGLVGSMERASITNSYATGKVEGSESVGGLVGGAWDGASIENSYATCKVSELEGLSHVYAGGLVGRYWVGVITNSYATGRVTVTGLKGSSCGGLIGGWYGSTEVINSYWDIQTTKQATSPGGGVGKTTEEMMLKQTYFNWDEKIWHLRNGFYPLLLQIIEKRFIQDKENLKDFIEGEGKYKNRSYHYIIKKSIDMKDIEITKLASTPFSGILAGSKRPTIKNLTINFPDQNDVGFLSETNGATINNLRFDHLNIHGYDFVGGLVANAKKTTLQNNTIENSTIEGTSYIGGIAGWSSDGNLENNSADNITLTGSTDIGGIIGESSKDEIIKCAASGKIIGQMHGACHPGSLGGIAGMSDSSNIENSYAILDIRSSQEPISFSGGIIGAASNLPTVKNCYSAGTMPLKGTFSCGGLIGAGYATVINSYWDREKTKITRSAAGGEGKTTEEMKQKKTYTNCNLPWNFTTIWKIKETETYPTLQWQGKKSDLPLGELYL